MESPTLARASLARAWSTVARPFETDAGAACLGTPVLGTAPVSNSPPLVAMVKGDFNNDGIADLGLPGPSVMLGRGDGTFLSPTGVAATDAVIAAADLNADCRLDAITSKGFQLGNGDGTFQPLQVLEATPATAVAVADLDSDGHPDVVFAGATLDVFLGNGTGTFRSAGPGPAFVAGALTVSDVDGDHHPDLVAVAANSDSVAVLVGNGDGTFQAPVLYAAGRASAALVLADFNGDGRPDIAVLDTEAPAIMLMLGAGGAQFQSAISVALPWTPGSLLAEDLNGDGHVDIAVTAAGQTQPTASVHGRVAVLLGHGDATFASATEWGEARYLAAVCPLVAGDFDGDAITDLALCLSEEQAFEVMLGKGDGTFRSERPSQVGWLIDSMASVDSTQTAGSTLCSPARAPSPSPSPRAMATAAFRGRARFSRSLRPRHGR